MKRIVKIALIVTAAITVFILLQFYGMHRKIMRTIPDMDSPLVGYLDAYNFVGITRDRLGLSYVKLHIYSDPGDSIRRPIGKLPWDVYYYDEVLRVFANTSNTVYTMSPDLKSCVCFTDTLVLTDGRKVIVETDGTWSIEARFCTGRK